MKGPTLHNTSAEQLFIGSLLLSAHAYWSAEDRISEASFHWSIHREVYRAIAELAQSRGKMSITLLAARLPEVMEGPDGEPAHLRDYLAALADEAQDAGIAPLDLAEQIAELASYRRMVSIGEGIIKAARKGEHAAIDIASEAESALLDVARATAPSRPVRIGEIARRALSTRKPDTGLRFGMTTGLRSLDEMIGLVMPGDLISVLGLPSEGKSALIAQMARHWAQSGHVLQCHNEMTEEQVGIRELAAESGIPLRVIREGAFDYWQHEDLMAAQKRLEAPTLFVWQDAKMSVRKIRSHALSLKRTVGLSAIAVDQLTRMRTDARVRDRWERYAEITGELKVLAMELSVPVVLAVQRTRMAGRRDDAVPTVDDAITPSIEQDSDTVLGVWREESWLMRNKPNKKAGGEQKEQWEHALQRARGIAEVIVLKLRSGERYQQCKFDWDGPRTLFREREQE